MKITHTHNLSDGKGSFRKACSIKVNFEIEFNTLLIAAMHLSEIDKYTKVTDMDFAKKIRGIKKIITLKRLYDLLHDKGHQYFVYFDWPNNEVVQEVENRIKYFFPELL